jgi:hypothetical protein
VVSDRPLSRGKRQIGVPVPTVALEPPPEPGRGRSHLFTQKGALHTIKTLAQSVDNIELQPQ